MAVSVRLPTVLRPHAAGKTVVEADAGSVGDIIAGLVARFPGMSGHLLNESGELQRFVNIYVDDDDIRYLDKAATAVADGAELTILPAVAGGA
ncbi:MAG: MoaD/ThiS family protein [Actinobacteria bacterium]|nr:MoaD/ThiS family protein [Actinomycetota bacterium]